MRHFLSRLKNKVMGSDMLFRYGEGTLALILSQTPQNATSLVTERLSTISNEIFQNTAHLRLSVAGFPEDSHEERGLIRKSLNKSI